jgi:hypothetical protein
MAAPTAIAYNRDGGPVQRTTGSATFAAIATDTYKTDTIDLKSGVLTLTLGFVPRYAQVVNVSTGDMVEWFAPMASGTSVDTAASTGVRTINASSKMVVTSRTGTGGSESQAGGTADTTPSGVIALTLSGVVADAGSIVWQAVG